MPEPQSEPRSDQQSGAQASSQSDVQPETQNDAPQGSQPEPQAGSAEPPFPPPPITEEMREQAKETPDSWLYIVDPAYQDYDSDDIPPEAVVGAFRIDSAGTIEEQFHYNEDYQPSELTMSMPEPANDLEVVLQKIAYGEADDEELPPAVLEAELLLYCPEESDLSVYAAEMSDGSQLVPACTSPGRVPDTWPGYRKVPGSVLPELLNGYNLGLNLDDPVRAVIPHEVLVETAKSI